MNSDQETEQRFRALFDGHPDAVFSLDQDGIFRNANAACEQVLGYAPARLLGAPFLPLVAGADRERARRYFVKATKGAPQRYQCLFRHGAGHLLEAHITHIPIVINGVVAGVYGLVQDVTSLRAARHERQQEQDDREQIEQELHRVIARANCLLWYATIEETAEGWLRWDNRLYDEEAAQRFLPLDVTGADGSYTWAWHRSTLDEDRERMAAYGAAQVRAGRSYSQEFRCRDREGQVRWLKEDVQIETLGPGRWRAVGVCTDVTSLKEAEAEKDRLAAYAQAAADRERVTLRDVLASVTEGRLNLCAAAGDLPAPLTPVGTSVALTPQDLSTFRRAVREAAQALGFEESRWQDLLMGVGEASMNAVVHGGGGAGRVCTDGRNALQVWVEDEGRGIAMEHLSRATLERGYTTTGTLGHGFWMILATVDRIWLMTGPSGTTVVLEQDRTQAIPVWA